MPLSDDQKAMLRLLAQREQGYEDLAALMGLSVDEVRAKVKDALAQLEAEGETPPSVPDPEPEPEPPAPPAAPEPEAAASEPAPAATPPTSPPPAGPTSPTTPEPAKPAAAAKPPRRQPPARPKLALPSGGGARAALVAGALVLVALVVVLIVGGGGDSGDDTSATTPSASEEPASNPTVGGKEVTQAVLEPVDGGDAKGLAVFGRVKNSLALQIQATGLDPTAKGESYTVWIADSPQKMLPLATTAVGQNGKIGAQVQVPTEVLGYLANETFDQMVITRTTDSTLKASLNKATSEKKAPAYTGTRVLEGQITGPIIGAADRLKNSE